MRTGKLRSQKTRREGQTGSETQTSGMLEGAICQLSLRKKHLHKYKFNTNLQASLRSFQRLCCSVMRLFSWLTRGENHIIMMFFRSRM